MSVHAKPATEASAVETAGDDVQSAPHPADRPWPRRWQPDFLRVLAQIPDVTAACRSAGIVASTAYRARHAQPDFDAAWEECLLLARDNIQRVAFTWATTGLPVRRRQTREKVNGSGEVVERVTTEWEDTDRSVAMMIFWLKSWYPDRYRDVQYVESTGKDGGPIQLDVKQEAADAAVDEFNARVVRLADARRARGDSE